MERRDCLKLIGGATLAAWVRPSLGESPADERANTSAFGASAITLGASGKENALVIRDFLRAGGFSHLTPTEAKVWWDFDQLHIEFLNTEHDRLYRGNTGLAKPIKFPGNDRFQLSAYPDAVYVQIRSSWKSEKTHTFAADSSGACEGDGYKCTVKRHPDMWTAQFEIPWKLLGGRPVTDSFGLNLLRSRGQSSEILSPVALDQTLSLPTDLMMSCSFAETPKLRSISGSLIELPDGRQRWQLPAKLVRTSREERIAIWEEQQTLNIATTPGTLPARIELAQTLHDALVLEGFSFHTDGSNWPVQPGEFYPDGARLAVNRALCRHDAAGACQALDVYLHQLDRVARRWFADESAGNIRAQEWVPVTSIGNIKRDGKQLKLDTQAGEFSFPLWLSVSNGAVRIRNQFPGHFQGDPDELVEAGETTFKCDGLHIQIEERPWRIVVRSAKGSPVWSIGDGDLWVRFLPNKEIAAIDIRGRLARSENLYGFGERFNALGQRGKIVTLWDMDCWEGNVHGQFNQAYKNVPLMHSTSGYSLFWNTSFRLRADMGSMDSESYRLTAFGNVLDFFIWPTKPEAALRSYTTITGKPRVPPRWAFQPWMGGGGRRWRNGPCKDAVLEEANVIKRFRELDIPHSAIYAEAGNADPALYSKLKGTDLRVLAWMWDCIDPNKLRELLPDVPEAQWPVVRHANGAIALRVVEGAAMIDFTHPGAVELIRRFWKPRLDLGLAGSMVDFGDVIPDDAIFYNGKRGTEMHNFRAYSYHQTFAQVFEEARGQDYVLFARAACAGDQHSIFYFAGDHQANFMGMRAALYGGLNAAACGLAHWGADAGGYAGWPDPEVYIRWTEWATFCPLMRYHGTTPREPWEFGEDAVAIYKRYAWLRENLVPYLEKSARETHETGIPLMRPMPMAFPDSPELANCDDQYMFGPDILVAPVLGPGKFRTVKLPPGRWTDFWTGETLNGSNTHRIATPLDRIGVFLRAGAVIPVDLAPSLVPGDSMTVRRLRAVLTTAPGPDAVRRAVAMGASHLVRYGGGAIRRMQVGTS